MFILRGLTVGDVAVRDRRTGEVTARLGFGVGITMVGCLNEKYHSFMVGAHTH